MSRTLIAIAAFLILAATGASSALGQERLCASGRGRAGSPIPLVIPLLTSDRGTILGTRLLASFVVGYKSEDHHFGTLAIMPGRGEPDQPLVTFADKNLHDEYWSCITYRRYWGPVSYDVIEKSGCRGTCTVTLSPPSGIADPVFVLQGFRVSYSESDHHIDRLAITERGGVLTVALNDKNDDDPFSFEVTYAYIPRAQFLVVSERRGAAHDHASGKTEVVGWHVIRGFDFNFWYSDHHIKQIELELSDLGRFDAKFADKNGDDQFAYRVEYGIIAWNCLTRSCPSRPLRWPLPVQPEVERPPGAAR
jgi:hypothetical protein